METKLPLWKEHRSKYTALHMWVHNHYGSANRCEAWECAGTSKTYHWANLSGEYFREREDFIMLCSSCHGRMDFRKPYCRNGHEYTPENSYIKPNGFSRNCRACQRASWHSRKKAKYGGSDGR